MFYALQVATGKEQQFISCASLSEDDEACLYFPQRLTNIRRKGQIKPELEPLFRGYVFLEIPKLDNAFRLRLKKTAGMFRFLPSNLDPQPLYGKDVDLLKKVLSFGKYADISQVKFNENDRIEIVAGPLKSLEGHIIRINKRKGRATVLLEMKHISMKSTLSFEILKVSDEKKEEA